MIKHLLSCVGKYKRDSILSPIYVSLEVVMEILIPLYMADLIDKGIDMGDLSVIWKYGLLLVVMCVISLAFGILSGRSAAIASTGFGKICGRSSIIRCRNFLSPISTNFPPPLSSPA